MAGRESTILYVLQDTIQRLDNLQGSHDCNSLVVRLEYLNRSIVNNAELVGLGSAVDYLKDVEREMDVRSNDCNGTKIYNGRLGRPSFDINEGQLSYLIDSGFTVPQISELLGASRRTTERRMSLFDITISGEGKAEFLVSF